jgi:parvulin-like peptidyl-prolyl isomerase
MAVLLVGLLAVIAGGGMIDGAVSKGVSVVHAADGHLSETGDDEIIVRVGERTITKAAIDLRTRQIAMKRRQKPGQAETAEMVDRLVEQTLFAEEARALGLDKDTTVQVLIQDTVDKLLANLYVRGHLLPSVQVSEAEVVDYYQAHQRNWKQPETVHARHILLRVKATDTADAVQAVEARAKEIRQRLAAGEDFAQLAREVSEDTGTKKQGGDLGFFTRKGKVAAISDTAFALKDGEISQPVRSSVGYHILQTLAHRPPGIKPLEAVRGEIRSQLMRRNKRQAAQVDRQRLEKKYHLQVHPSYRLDEMTDAKPHEEKGGGKDEP